MYTIHATMTSTCHWVTIGERTVWSAFSAVVESSSALTSFCSRSHDPMKRDSSAERCSGVRALVLMGGGVPFGAPEGKQQQTESASVVHCLVIEPGD